jgi:hypothetical protein
MSSWLAVLALGEPSFGTSPQNPDMPSLSAFIAPYVGSQTGFGLNLVHVPYRGPGSGAHRPTRRAGAGLFRRHSSSIQYRSCAAACRWCHGQAVDVIGSQFAGSRQLQQRGGESDLILRDSNTGALQIYNINNNPLTGTASIAFPVGADWQFAGVAPISAAGASDPVLRNVNSGEFQVYNSFSIRSTAPRAWARSDRIGSSAASRPLLRPRQGRRLESDMMKRPCCVDRPMFAPSGFAANREKEGLRLVILTTLTYTGLTAGGKTRIPPGFSSPLHRFDNATVCHCRLIEFAPRRPDLFSRTRTRDRSGEWRSVSSSQDKALDAAGKAPICVGVDQTSAKARSTPRPS